MIIIRNPVLQIPSVYQSVIEMTQCRPGDEDFEATTSLKLCRLIFDVFQSQGKRPIVVDAEDMLWRTKDLGTSLCAALDIDPQGLKDQWPPLSDEQKPSNHPVMMEWTKTIFESTGIQRPAEKVLASRIACVFDMSCC